MNELEYMQMGFIIRTAGKKDLLTVTKYCLACEHWLFVQFFSKCLVRETMISCRGCTEYNARPYRELSDIVSKISQGTGQQPCPAEHD